MVQTRRERLREETYQEIKRITRKQMKEQGATALSLRAIAAEMGMTAPAIYRYFSSRDELVTALIVDAYNSLADFLTEASRKPAPDDYGTRFMATVMAFREWALANREEYILIFGTPIPGYHAPEEITTPAAWRVNEVFARLMEEAWQNGALTVPAEYEALASQFTEQSPLGGVARFYGFTMPQTLGHMLMEGWGQIQGLVALELYGHFDYLGEYAGELYRITALAYLRRLGLNPKT